MKVTVEPAGTVVAKAVRVIEIKVPGVTVIVAVAVKAPEVAVMVVVQVVATVVAAVTTPVVLT